MCEIGAGDIGKERKIKSRDGNILVFNYVRPGFLKGCAKITGGQSMVGWLF